MIDLTLHDNFPYKLGRLLLASLLEAFMKFIVQQYLRNDCKRSKYW